MLSKKILTDTLLLSVATIVAQVLSVGQSIVTLRLLDPAALGTWLGALLVMTYAAYAHAGLDHGMALRLPYYRGRGDVEQVALLSDTAFVAWTLIAVTVAAGMIVYATVFPQPSALTRISLIVVCLMIPLNHQVMFLSRWQTSVPVDFKLGSVLSVAQSLFSFCVVVPLAFFFNVRGVMWGTLIVNAVVFALWRWKSPYRPRLRVSRAALSELVRIGFPMLLVAVGGTMLQTIDRVTVLSLLGSAALGWYNITGLGGNIIYSLISQAGNALSPHIVQDVGLHRDEPWRLERFLQRPTVGFAVMASGMTLPIVFLVPAFVRVVLPKYVPGIPAFYGFVGGFFFLAITLTAANLATLLLIERGAQRWMVYLQALAVGVEAGGAVLLIKLGWGILGAALASTLSYAVYGCVLVGIAARLILRTRRERLLLAARIATPLALAVATALLVYFVGERLGPSNMLVRGALEAAAATSIFLALSYPTVRDMGVIPDYLAPTGLRRVFRRRIASASL